MPTTSRTATDPDDSHGSAVTLRGRVTGLPEERTLPSGDVLMTFRISAEITAFWLSDWPETAIVGMRDRIMNAISFISLNFIAKGGQTKGR